MLGGDGFAVDLNNAVSGWTNGGALDLSQSATGGVGGDSDSGAPGMGGAGISSLDFDDSTSLTQSVSIDAASTATGGRGGGASDGDGAMGASATSSLTVIGEQVVDEHASSATGGLGGFAGSHFGQGGGVGGDANASVVGVGQSVDRRGRSAAGGAGGTGYNGRGGGGGGATATAKGTATGSGEAQVSATEIGGDGKYSLYGPGAGIGASVSMNNAVSGSTVGGDLILSQRAVAGGAMGIFGIGGSATSTLVFNDTAHIAQSAYLEADISAQGGVGGGFAGPGGSAVAAATLTGAGTVIANASALGGMGGGSTSPFGGGN